MEQADISQAIRGELFSTMISMCSFEQVMQCLFSTMEKFVPTSFMICYYVNHHSAHATTLAYAGDLNEQPRLEATRIHLLTHEDRREHSYDKERRIFWHKDYREDPVIRRNLEAIFPHDFSVMGMVLNETRESHIIISFVAKNIDGFEREHAELLKYIYPLCQTVVNKFFPTEEEPLSSLTTPLEQAENALRILRECKGMSHSLRRAEAAAGTDINVLIEGESGVGKDLLAKAVHHLSGRARFPLVICNCGALPENLLDSLLFGHERGAFTGAHGPSKGYFEQAQNGTLFLDEVGELSPAAQTRLLRVLEDRSIRRVGSDRVLPVNVRVLAATNRSLKQEVAGGRFREDLWYRLNHYRIEIPPLRRRREDIPVLARYFCQVSPGLLNIPGRFHLSPESERNMLSAPWPGNVRQLRHVIEEAMVEASIARRSVLNIHMGGREEALRETDEKKEHPIAQDGTGEKMEDDILLEAIKSCHGRVSGPLGAAGKLGLHPQTVRARLFRMGLKPKDLREKYKLTN